jgi:hypothetical protein
MVFNATFNNISVILWQSVLLAEETGVPGENHRPAASHWQAIGRNFENTYGWVKFYPNTLVKLLNRERDSWNPYGSCTSS